MIKNYMFFGLLISSLILGGTIPAHASDSISEQGDKPVEFLFIHHSCGGQLLADVGSNVGEKCIYSSHPNGGGLRALLEDSGFAVNEASYDSVVGEDTDICHWHQKFRDNMELILKTKNQDDLLPEGTTNAVVAFKSCYPNNRFSGEGSGPGDADSCELTLVNAKAAYNSLLPYFAGNPDVLFVAFTAPPLAKTPGFKAFLKRTFKGSPKHPEWARSFNSWLMDSENGWLSGYSSSNVAVFDHYDILTKNGKTNWSAYPTGDGGNSHPSSEGNTKAAEAFVVFLKEAMGSN